MKIEDSMKKEVNRALVAKKMYVTPLVEVTQINMEVGVLALTSGGALSPAPRPRGGKLW